MIGSIKPNKSPYLVGIAGGSGSGKTYLAKKIRDALGESRCGIVYQDNFYHDQSHRFDRDGGAVNFDHPDALDFSFLATILSQLKQGQEVEIPEYDFVTHKRKQQLIKVPVRDVYLIDGILLLHPEEVRRVLDLRVFVMTPESVRYSRRLERDTRERGRTAEGVHEQFYQQVKPMHDLFVEPSKQFADLLVPDASLEEVLLKLCVQIQENI